VFSLPMIISNKGFLKFSGATKVLTYLFLIKDTITLNIYLNNTRALIKNKKILYIGKKLSKISLMKILF